MNEIILAQDASESTITGLGAVGYGIATIGPGLGIGILVERVEMRPGIKPREYLPRMASAAECHVDIYATGRYV